MAEETWKCPACLETVSVSERVCPLCKSTRADARLGEEESAQFLADSVAIELPHVIPEVRFSVPTECGPEWSSGLLVAIEAGLAFLSPKDGLGAEQFLAAIPAFPGRIGSSSFYAPLAIIRRLVNHKLTGQFLEVEGNKPPLRFDAAGWKAIDAVCARLGIPRTLTSSPSRVRGCSTPSSASPSPSTRAIRISSLRSSRPRRR